MVPRRRVLQGFGAALAVLAVAAPAAQAGTLTMTSTTLSFTASAGEVNDVAVEVSNGNTRFSDAAPITVSGALPAQCVRDAPAPDTHQVRCGKLALASATVALGDQYDTVHAFGPIKLTANGGRGTDTLIGGTLNDVLTTGPGDNEMVSGGSGDDTIDTQETLSVLAVGNDGNDTIYGPRDGAGTGKLWGDAGNDMLVAYDGDNQLTGGSGGDKLTGGAGTDLLRPGFADVQRGFRAPVPVTTPDKDTVAGGDGRDVISYKERTNPVWVTLGGTSTNGEACAPGSASCEGDTIAADVETAWGGGGDDHLTGDAGSNALAGGGGNDTLIGKAGADGLCGDGPDASYDHNYSGSPHFNVSGFLFVCDDPNPSATGVDNDTLIGGDGDDALDGNHGADTVEGDAGYDFTTYAARGAGVVVTPDNVANDGTPAATGVAAEKDNVKSDVERIEGGYGNDKLTGGLADNQLWGGGGNDTLAGGAGDDTLCGGRDVPGDFAGHTLYGDTAGCSYDVYDPSSDGDDKLVGGDGDDTLDGGRGSNTLNGGPGLADTASYAGRDEPVGVTLDANRNDGVNCPSACQNDSVGAVPGSTPDIENVVGGLGNDTIAAGTAAVSNTFNGGGGSDTLSGGAGGDMLLGGYVPGTGDDDVYNGGTGFDYVSYADGRDTYSGDPLNAPGVFARIDGTPSSGYGCGDPGSFSCEHDTIKTDVEGLIGTGGDDTLSGSGLANALNGRAGTDTLLGLGGNDVLNGGSGAGDDSLNGGEGADRLNSRDSNPDEDLVCGAGADTVTKDAGDNSSVDCESVTATAAAR
ncbi:MAG TPA: calcium-binding protein [Solirubrobacteraceae bacterium]|jgi:Ca2+-binding RTX toxin-like protein